MPRQVILERRHFWYALIPLAPWLLLYAWYFLPFLQKDAGSIGIGFLAGFATQALGLVVLVVAWVKGGFSNALNVLLALFLLYGALQLLPGTLISLAHLII